MTRSPSVTAPSTCPEPIYQLTPEATIPAVTPLPVCPVGGVTYPVAVESTAAVTQLPSTGSGPVVEPMAGLLLMVALVLGVLVLGFIGSKAAARKFEEQCPECLP